MGRPLAGVSQLEMVSMPEGAMESALAWCSSVLGPVEVMSDHSKTHPGHETSTCRLRTPEGIFYLKVHETRSHWQNEVHAYERWAPAFGDRSPRLIAVRDESPSALITGELPGQVLLKAELSPDQERAIWRAAGSALTALHALGPGEGFGACLRDGTCAEKLPRDAIEYVSTRLRSHMERALEGGYIADEERATVQAVYGLIPAFEGERPIPCHRDYCADNLLVSKEGTWTGVIDFEFACWDLRVADFTRDPNWSWVCRPDLFSAFLEGYGISRTPRLEQQLLVAHAEYALAAILWGHDSGFHGFEREGHESLAHLATLLK